MIKTVWKYPLDAYDKITLLMPENAEILTVKLQYGIPCIWALVNPFSVNSEERYFGIYGTGHDIQYNDTHINKYIGTFMPVEDTLVFHVFEHIKQIDK